MNLDTIIHLILKPDVTYNCISRNNQYINHYQYLQELSKQSKYLKRCSFGLNFEKENSIANVLFFKQLVSDGSILLENHKILSLEKISSVSFYLPVQVSIEQDILLNFFMDEIDRIRNIFLEKYSEEIDGFQSICQNIVKIKSGNRVLKKYIQNHLVGINIRDKGV